MSAAALLPSLKIQTRPKMHLTDYTKFFQLHHNSVTVAAYVSRNTIKNGTGSGLTAHYHYTLGDFMANAARHHRIRNYTLTDIGDQNVQLLTFNINKLRENTAYKLHVSIHLSLLFFCLAQKKNLKCHFPFIFSFFF